MEIDLSNSTAYRADETKHVIQPGENTNRNNVSEPVDPDLHDNIRSASSSSSPEDVTMETDENAASKATAINPSSSLKSFPLDINSSNPHTIEELIEYLATQGDPQLEKISKVNVDNLKIGYVCLREILKKYNRAMHKHTYLVQRGYDCINNSYQKQLRVFVKDVVKIRKSQEWCDIIDMVYINDQIISISNYMLLYSLELRSILKHFSQLVYKLYDYQEKFVSVCLKAFLDTPL